MDCFNCNYPLIKFLLVLIIITLSMSSNGANSTSNGTWGELPTSASSVPPLDYSDGGLAPYFGLTRSFVYNSLLMDPLDVFVRVKDGKIDSEIITYIIKKNIGFIVAVAVGILFIVIFSVVGLCFCCCRNCNKCGGKKIQKNRCDKRRKIFIFFLLIMVLFCIAGLACMFTSLSQIERNAKSVPQTIEKSVNFINYYVDELIGQVNFIGNKTETLLMDAIEYEMDHIGTKLGGELQKDIDTNTNIKSLFQDIRQFDTEMKNIQSILHDVNSTMVDLELAVNTMQHNLTTLKKNINAKCQPCGPMNELKTEFDPAKLPDLTQNNQKIDDVVNKGVGSSVDPLEKNFNDIPELVQNNSQKISEDMKNVIKTFRTTIGKYRNQTKSLKTNMSNSISELTDLKKAGLGMSYEEFVDTFDKYWLAVWAPFGGIAVLIVVLQFLGLILGTCGNGSSVKTTERNSTSNCGGICLMFSVGLMFFFGWLFMAFTTLTYIPGSILERYGCNLIRTIDTGSIDKALVYVMPDKDVFGEILPIKINITISGVYSRCKAGESIPEAMEADIIINNTVKDFQKQIEIKDKINTISVDLSNVKIMDNDVESWFKDMKSGMDINFTKFNAEFSVPATHANLSEVSNILRTQANSGTPVNTDLIQLAENAESIEKNDLNRVITLKNELKNHINSLESTRNKSLLKFDSLTSKINASQDFLNNKLNDTVKQRLYHYADDLLGIWNNFVSNIFYLLTKMMSCKPLVDLFEFLAIDFACGTVDAFNGFWFGLGWFIFFSIPGIILSVKLAKYYRRMRHSDEMDSSTIPMTENAQYGYHESNQFINNKVGQM